MRTTRRIGFKNTVTMKSIRNIVVCLLVLFLIPGYGQGQEEASVAQGEDAGVLPVWDDNLIGPPAPSPLDESPSQALFPPELEIPPTVAVYSDDTQQIPVLKVMGDYFDPSGFCATGPLSEVSSQSIRSQMVRTFNMGFRCFMLRVDWPSIEPQANRFDASRVRDLLQYANDLGLKVIISLELDRAPAWFFQAATGSGRITVSYLVDPEMEYSVGNDGDLRWANGTGIPLMYHPDTMRAINNLIHSLYNTIKGENAFLGWFLCGPSTLSFPGGGRNGVVGMSDYSPYSVNHFFQETGTPLVAYPLPRYSRGMRDSRVEFRMFLDFRLSLKRETFDQIVAMLREFDSEHMILVGMKPVLNYRTDNGYLSMIQVPDYTRQMLHEDVNGVVVSFKLASDTFEPLAERTETSAMHLALTINQIVRNGRLAIVLIETDTVNKPSTFDILDIADMIKAAGGYPVWCSGFIQKRSSRWSWTEQNAIERTQPLSILPPPKQLRRGQVAILDIPSVYSSYYCERNGNIVLALTQLAIHQRTGVLLEMVGVNELVSGEPVLDEYTNLIMLVPEVYSNENTFALFDPMQRALEGYRNEGGVIESVDPMLLHQYALENYQSPVLEDQLRIRYVHRGASANQLNGADVFVVANDPYVFIRINQLHGARYINVKLNGWDEENRTMLDVVELPSSDLHRVEVISGNANFQFSPAQNIGHLYVLADDYGQVAKPYEARKTSVAIAQQARQMRRSVPAALLLLALLAVTMVWMSFQCQQKSLIQAAELVDRSRRIEPIDILDEPDVMEFYRQYISENGNGSPGPDKSIKKFSSGTKNKKS